MMLLVFVALLSVVAGFTYTRNVARGWSRVEKPVPKDATVAFRLALHQRNLDVLERETIERATPSSNKYSQWFTPAEVLDLVAPPSIAVETCVKWAKSQGLKADGSRRDVVLVEGSVAAIEKALQCELALYVHEPSGTTHLRALQWTLPEQVHQYVAVLSGLTEFWPKPRAPKSTPLAERFDKRHAEQITWYGMVIPDVVRKLYNIPKDSFRKTSLGSSIAVVEFLDYGSYEHQALTYFDQQCGEDRSHVDHIVGPYQGNNPQLESSLDIQYASTLALNSTYWYWTATGWLMEFSNDLFANPGPLVVSMSWGWFETGQCQQGLGNCTGITAQQYVQRVDAEFLKITATGVSLLAASGDQGAPGDQYYANCNGLSDIYPGASPWVTSVGATMLGGDPLYLPSTAGPPACSDNSYDVGCATTTDEVVCSIWSTYYQDAIITSGGGFATYQAMPSWQSAVVNQYLKSASLPPSSSFNAKNRAFPDVAAIGHDVLIAVTQGGLEAVDGTSCSSPIVASMVALWNGWRLNNGKKALGFLNPMIYAAAATNSSIFKDITSGDNGCSEFCCDSTYGFPAAVGWDAATGFGGIYFDKMLSYVQTLK